VIEIVLNRWDFKIIERELIAMGLVPNADFFFAWTIEEPLGWAITFTHDEDAMIWRLMHEHKWV
jgi:hypothetical protein